MHVKNDNYDYNIEKIRFRANRCHLLNRYKFCMCIICKCTCKQEFQALKLHRIFGFIIVFILFLDVVGVLSPFCSLEIRYLKDTEIIFREMWLDFCEVQKLWYPSDWKRFWYIDYPENFIGKSDFLPLSWRIGCRLYCIYGPMKEL